VTQADAKKRKFHRREIKQEELMFNANNLLAEMKTNMKHSASYKIVIFPIRFKIIQS
jgi:hypothetical protein